MDGSLAAAAGLGAGFMGGLTYVLGRGLMRSIRPRDFVAINFLMVGLPLLAIAPWFFRFDVSWGSVFAMLGMGVSEVLASIFLFQALEKGEASVVSPLIALAPGFTFLLEWLVMGHTVEIHRLVAALVIMGVVVFLTIDPARFRSTDRRVIVLSLATAMLIGPLALIVKYLTTVSHASNIITVFFIRCWLGAALSWIVYAPRTMLSFGQYRSIFLRGLAVSGRQLLMYVSASLGSAGIAVTLLSTTPIFVFFIGAAFLHEKPTWRKLVAASVALSLSFVI